MHAWWTTWFKKTTSTINFRLSLYCCVRKCTMLRVPSWQSLGILLPSSLVPKEWTTGLSPVSSFSCVRVSRGWGAGLRLRASTAGGTKKENKKPVRFSLMGWDDPRRRSRSRCVPAFDDKDAQTATLYLSIIIQLRTLKGNLKGSK
jgi:hypothetical protein